jgi:hypothetical protein
MLMKIFGPKSDEATGEWRRLRNEELYDLYTSLNIIRVIKSRMRWAGPVACMGDSRGAQRVLVGRCEGQSHVIDLGVDGSIILKWIFKTWAGEAWTGLIWLTIETGGGRL